MNIKPFIAAAVIALTAACTEEPTVVEVPEEVELNDDGTPVVQKVLLYRMNLTMVRFGRGI